MKTCVIVFAKNPIPNAVKTRLIPPLSPEQAATLYTAFLTDWCEALAELRDVDLVIAYTPADAQPDLQALISDDAIYIPQVGIDLGERLTSATQWAAEHGYTKILIVGSDSPTLPISYISQALTLLDSRNIVIGPSTDGGYYLIGFSVKALATTVPHVFEEIAWSTADVFQQTVTRIGEVKVTFGLLPPWYDIDTPEDLAFLHAHISAIRLAGGSVQAVRTEFLLTKLFS
ncbi:glycosyltransferase [Candidatus Poribacteria bacterium]|nr:glycosyltransferase [Candidatus Poribacteria bacterium]MYH79374.1 glycosyltransferase [Candidatus Poribacteria bacterium]MYK93864.1 glycosyltransferase [Candidatus Poribacteria bacterium]